MRRLFTAVVLVIVALQVFASAALAAEAPGVLVNGETVRFDVPPVIRGGRTFLPVRRIAETLGAEVEWDGVERKVTVKTSTVITELWLDRLDARVNGDLRFLDEAPFVVEGRTMLPLRFIAEMLSFVVDWDDLTRSVYLTAPGSVAPTQVVVESDVYSVRQGETVTVQVWLRRSRAAYTAVVNLAFDPTILEAQQVTPGTIIEGLLAARSFDNQAGRVDFAASRVGVVRGFSGDGVLYSVTFKAKASGTVRITPLADSQVIDSGLDQLELVRNGLSLQVD